MYCRCLGNKRRQMSFLWMWSVCLCSIRHIKHEVQLRHKALLDECAHTHSPTHHQSSSIKHPWLGQRHPSACHILHNVPTFSWKPEQGDEELNTEETHIPKSWDRVSCAGHDGGYQHNSNLETQHIYFIYLNQGYVIFKKRKSLNLRWSY